MNVDPVYMERGVGNSPGSNTMLTVERIKAVGFGGLTVAVRAEGAHSPDMDGGKHWKVVVFHVHAAHVRIPNTDFPLWEVLPLRDCVHLPGAGEVEPVRGGASFVPAGRRISPACRTSPCGVVAEHLCFDPVVSLSHKSPWTTIPALSSEGIVATKPRR